MVSAVDPLRDVNEGISIDDYLLKYGLFWSFDAERAMLRLTASHRETPVAEYLDGIDTVPTDILDIYAHEGAFTHEGYFAVFDRMGLDPSVEALARLSADRRFACDDVYLLALEQEPSLWVPDPGQLVLMLSGFSEYAARLPRAKRMRLEELWTE